jgi:hypothetical protein
MTPEEIAEAYAASSNAANRRSGGVTGDLFQDIHE